MNINKLEIMKKIYQILSLSDFESAFNSFEREIEFAEKENIQLVGFDDDNYPLEYKNIKEPLNHVFYL